MGLLSSALLKPWRIDGAIEGFACWLEQQLMHPKTPCSSTPFLSKVENIIEMPQNDGLPLLEASRICNTDIIGRVQQVGQRGSWLGSVTGCRLPPAEACLGAS